MTTKPSACRKNENAPATDITIDGKDDSNDDSVILEDYVPIPPDGGWGWVVVFASFMANMVVDGIMYTFGIYLKEFQSEFDSAYAMTAFIGSLLAGFYMLVGPIVGGLVIKFGARAVMISGGIISTVAFLMSSFAETLAVMMVTYEVIGVYGWRGTLWFQAGLALNCVVFGVLLRPLKTRCYPIKLQNKLIVHEESLKETLSDMNNVIRKISIAHQDSNDSNSRRTSKLDVAALRHFVHIWNSISETEQNIATVEEDQVVVEERVRLEPRIRADLQSADDKDGAGRSTSDSHYHVAVEVATSVGEQKPVEDKDRTQPGIKTNVKGLIGRLHRSVSLQAPSRPPSVRPISKKWRRATVAAKPDHHRQAPAASVRKRQRIPIDELAESLQLIQGGRPRSAILSVEAVFNLAGVDVYDLSRPMYHRDALYSGSAGGTVRRQDTADDIPSAPKPDGGARMARFSRQISIPHAVVFDETLGGTVPKAVLDDGGSRSHCVCIPASVWNVVTEMVDVRLVCFPEMAILILSGVFAALSFFTPYVYVTARAEQIGIPHSQASFLLSIIGIANTLGRVVFGWMADQPWTTALTINNCALLFCGIITFLVPWLNTYPLLVAYCALFGFAISAFISLASIILVELLTLDNLTNAFGLLILSRGATGIFGSPLSGVIYDLTQSYDASFWVAGVLLILSGLISCTIPVYRWRKLRQPHTVSRVENNEAFHVVGSLPGKSSPKTLRPSSSVALQFDTYS